MLRHADKPHVTNNTVVVYPVRHRAFVSHLRVTDTPFRHFGTKMPRDGWNRPGLWLDC